MNEWAELDRALDAMASSGSAEVREDGQWLAELTGLRCEFRAEGKNPLVHLWSEERNLTRRILRVREQSQDRIVLEVQRFGRAKPGRLEFLRTDSPRATGARHPRTIPRALRALSRRALSRRRKSIRSPPLPISNIRFPGSTSGGACGKGRICGLFSQFRRAKARPRSTGFSRLHFSGWTGSARTPLPTGSRVCACSSLREPAGPCAREPWRFRRRRAPKYSNSTTSTAAWKRWMRRNWETSKAGSRCAAKWNRRYWRLRKAQRAFRHSRRCLSRGPGACARMRCRVRRKSRSLFTGWNLPAGRAKASASVWATGSRRLTGTTAPRLEQLVRQLVLYRSPLASDVKHPLYRAAPERWLETLVLEEPDRLDAQLDPTHLYSQVPALSAGDRGVIDLLGITRRGRLVVIELKASEDIQLPIQALDYWLRVRRHQLSGDFHRYGYFAGKEFDPKPPLVWLVAPGLHFHPATRDARAIFFARNSGRAHRPKRKLAPRREGHLPPVSVGRRAGTIFEGRGYSHDTTASRKRTRTVIPREVPRAFAVPACPDKGGRSLRARDVARDLHVCGRSDLGTGRTPQEAGRFEPRRKGTPLAGLQPLHL